MTNPVNDSAASEYSLAELMICAGAEAFRNDGEVLATGIGLIPRPGCQSGHENL